jgi:RND family efflux transporter MFP subunit
MMKKRSGFVLTLALFGGCTVSNAEQSESVPPVAVRLEDVTVTEVAQPITAAGTLGAKEEVALGFKVGGVVANVAVNAGETVRAGQVLAALELREIDASVQRAQSAADRAEREFARAQRLYADSVVALAQLQDTETARDVARADLDAARFNRRYAVIVAPAAGVVLRRMVEPGELVAPGASVLVLGSRARGTVLRVGLPDRDAVRVRRGNPATVRFEALPNHVFTGEVSEIGAAVDAPTGTVSVEITLSAGDDLFSGLVGTAEIQPATTMSATLVPVAAVLEADAAQGTVFTLASDGRSVQRRVVRIAYITGDRVVVTAGLDGVQQVITDGAAYLNDGTKVRVIQ